MNKGFRSQYENIYEGVGPITNDAEFFRHILREATKFHKHLAQLIAEKRSENYSTVMGFIRKRLRFTLLRTVLESLRGSRGIRRNYLNRAWKIQDTDINMIDYRDSDFILQNDI